MKKFSSALVLFALAFTHVQAQTKTAFTLSGKVSGVSDGLMYLYYSGANDARIKDSTVIANGNFRFKGNMPEPGMAYLQLKEDKRSEANSLSFFLEPADITMDLNLDAFRDAKFAGAKMQEQYAGLIAEKKKLEQKYSKQLDSLRTEKDHEKNAEIRERLAPFFYESDVSDFKFFERNPKSAVTAYLLRFHTGDVSLDSLQGYYDKLGYATQQTAAGKYVLDELIKLRGGSPGSMAKDFTALDINGKQLTLSEFKGKYVLIDFWASWCVPCRKGNPHLKEVYAKYKPKGFEIIGIADDDRAEQAWKDAVKKDDIGMWRHIRRGLKYENGNFDRSTDVSEKFGIHTLPTKILIDPQGKIIGRFSEDEAPMDKKLKEVFEGVVYW